MTRYYSTKKRGQVINKDEFSIIDTDDRVKNFFEPTPSGYIKAYTVDGLPFNEIIPTVESKSTQKQIEEIEEKIIILKSKVVQLKSEL